MQLEINWVGRVRLVGRLYVSLVFNGLSGSLFQTFTESLILAQDERWRRA
jgi:hypothetical protein